MKISSLLLALIALSNAQDSILEKLGDIEIFATPKDETIPKVFRTMYTFFPLCVFRWSTQQVVCCVNETRLLKMTFDCSFEKSNFLVQLSPQKEGYEQFYSNHSRIQEVAYVFKSDRSAFEGLSGFHMARPQIRRVAASKHVPYPYKCKIPANNKDAFVQIRGVPKRLPATRRPLPGNRDAAYLSVMLEYADKDFDQVDCFLNANAVPYTTNIYWKPISIDGVDYIDGSLDSNEMTIELSHKKIQVTENTGSPIDFSCFTNELTEKVYWSYISYSKSSLIAIQYRDRGEIIMALDGNLESFKCEFSYVEGSKFVASHFKATCIMKLRLYAKFRCMTEAMNFMPVYYVHAEGRRYQNDMKFLRFSKERPQFLRCFAKSRAPLQLFIFNNVFKKWDEISRPYGIDPSSLHVDTTTKYFYHDFVLNYTGVEFQQVYCNNDNKSFPEWYIYWSESSDLEDAFPAAPLYTIRADPTQEVLLIQYEHDPLAAEEFSIIVFLKFLLLLRFIIGAGSFFYLIFFGFKIPTDDDKPIRNREPVQEEAGEDEDDEDEDEEEEEENQKEKNDDE